MCVVVRAAVLAAAFALGSCSPQPQEAMFVQTAEGLTGYLGVVPRGVVEVHAPEHVERRMHPASPIGDVHVVVALFDAVSGARVEDADVEAVLRGDRHRGGRRLRLEPMRVDGALTYGAFTSLARNDRYHIDVVVRRPGVAGETHLRFVFEAAGLPVAEPRRR